MTRRRLCAAIAIVGACLAAAFLMHIYAGSFSRFMADTFCYAAPARHGLLKAQWSWYNSWTGRFWFNLLESLTATIGPRIAPLLPGLALIAWLLMLVAVLLQFRRTLPIGSALLFSIAVALLILHVTLDGIPQVAQSLYWADGMHNYVSPLILATGYVWLIIWTSGGEGGTLRRAIWPAAGVVAFLAAGCSEMGGALQIAGLGLLLLAGVLVGSPKFRQQLLPPMAAALAGLLLAYMVVFLAPGNKVRQQSFPPPPPPWTLVRMAVSYTWRFALATLQRAPLAWLGTLVLPGVLGAALRPEEGARPATVRNALRGLMWLPPAALAVLIVCFAAPAYGLSQYPPGRSSVIPQYLLAWAVVIWAYLAGGLVRRVELGRILGREVIIWQAVLALALLALSGNALLAARRTSARAQSLATYAAAWDERDQLIREARAQGIKRVAVPPLKNPIGLGDIQPDPEYWINQCVGANYGVTVLAQEPLLAPSVAEMEQMIPLEAHIGDAAAVLGYALSEQTVRAGDALSVTVYWRPEAATERPYTVFVHLYDGDGQLVAQCDGYPGQGKYPTNTWVYDQPFADTYGLTLPEGLTANGAAQVVVGLYDIETMERLPVSGADTVADRRWVGLGTVQMAQ